MSPSGNPEPQAMKITTRLILSFLLVSVAPLALMGYLGLQAMDGMRAVAVGESTKALRDLGEASIQQKAVDVARQVELYLDAHPEFLALSPQDWSAEADITRIAVQPVGETGYTAVYDQEGVVYAHANPAMVGRNMGEFAESLPAFWAIFEASLDGSVVASYYEWQEADGSLRDKYMSCVPVGDTPLRVAATTYIDEFSQPMRQTEMQINRIFSVVQRYLLAGLAILGGAVLVLGFWLAWGISRPILDVAEAAVQVESGEYQAVSLERVSRRKDELGRLASVFQRMVAEVNAREERLKKQVRELRVEIDEVQKQRQVAEITETEYFRQLLIKIEELKRRHEAGIGKTDLK